SIRESVTAETFTSRAAPGFSVGRVWASGWRLVRQKPLGAVSAVVILGLIVVAIMARMQAPSTAFPLGTDPLGRDVLSRIVYGARVSLVVGFASVIAGTLLGTALGLASGYWEGRLDYLIQRGVDTAMAIPGIVLALAVMSVLGQSLTNIVLVIALVIAPGASRVVRGTVLAVKQLAFVDAAHASGASQWRIVVQHVLPNVFAPILIIATVWLGNAIVIEAALSFLGLGTPPPTPSWGA